MESNRQQLISKASHLEAESRAIVLRIPVMTADAIGMLEDAWRLRLQATRLTIQLELADDIRRLLKANTSIIWTYETLQERFNVFSVPQIRYALKKLKLGTDYQFLSRATTREHRFKGVKKD